MREIALSRGLVATVDDGDYEFLSQWKWSALKTGRKGAEPIFYACRVKVIDGKQKMILMHRLVSGAVKGEVVDHKDRNTLNNTRENLRVCTQADNCLNRVGNKTGKKTSKYKGVYKDRQYWRARFRDTIVGSYASEEEARRAYDEVALRYSPEYALVNSSKEVCH